MAPSSKPVTLLKRGHIVQTASAPSPSSGISDRIAETIRVVVDGALARERQRMQSVYVVRQEALLNSLVYILQNDFKKSVSTAAETEAKALAAAVATLTIPGAVEGNQSAKSRAKGATKAGKMTGRPASDDDVTKLRAGFRTAFEAQLLDSIESALRKMLTAVSDSISAEVENTIAGPSADKAAFVLRQAADQSRADLAQFTSVVGKYGDGLGLLAGGSRDSEMELAKSIDPEEAAMADVCRALGEGKIRNALELSLGCSAVVRAKALEGALESDMAPEDVLTDEERPPSLGLLSSVIAFLASDLGDRTKLRLAWISEATMVLEDCEPAGDEASSSASRQLSAAVEKLKGISVLDGFSAAEIKEAKLLIRCINVSVQSLAA